MELYHGSTVEVCEPRLIQSGRGRDFGLAFYTTQIKKQAERWAWRHAKVNRLNNGKDTQALVSVYDFQDEQAMQKLSWKHYPEANLEWLDFILRCRAAGDFFHGWDIVSGKVANDRVGETIAFVQQGFMRKEDALARLKFQRINNQYAFCTYNALKYLHFKYSYLVEEEPQDD